MRRRLPLALWVDLAVKAALVGLLLLAVARPDLPEFAGKAMTGRALAYSLAAVLVPVVWWLLSRRRGRRLPSPYALDVLLVLPFLILPSASPSSATRPRRRPHIRARSATWHSA